MKNVAFLLCSNTIGGHEYQSIELILSSQRYCNPTAFINTPEQESLCRNNNIHYIKSPFNFFKYGNFIFQYFYAFRYHQKIYHLVEKYDIVVVCAGSVEAGICCGISLYIKKPYLYVPMYVDRAQLWGRIGKLYNLLFGLFLAPFNKIITINNTQGEIFSKYSNTIVIPNHIETTGDPIITTSCNRDRRLYFVGRLDDKQKRLIELLSWLDSPQNPFKNFIIIGGGNDKKKIDKKIAIMKYISVTELGWMTHEEQENTIFSNDVFISNSAYEGEPMAIREANNRGSQVIARNIIGHRDCTFIENQYKNKKELYKLLSLAYNGRLKVFKNQDVNEIEAERIQAIKRLFI